jgi:hypothetical protein
MKRDPTTVYARRCLAAVAPLLRRNPAYDILDGGH